MSVKSEKGNILRPEVEYLGHISTKSGLRPTDKHVKAIVEMPPPVDKENGKINKTSLRSFIGMVKYDRRYIANCGKLCEPLNSQLKDDADGVWGPVHDMVFTRLKLEMALEALLLAPSRQCPQLARPLGSRRYQ